MDLPDLCYLTVACSEMSSTDRDLEIRSQDGKKAGKVRGIVGKHGLGLIRLEFLERRLNAACKDLSTVYLSALKPCWWPIGF